MYFLSFLSADLSPYLCVIKNGNKYSTSENSFMRYNVKPRITKE